MKGMKSKKTSSCTPETLFVNAFQTHPLIKWECSTQL